MQEKMKGITFTSVYDEKKFISEVNDEPSETVTTGYIPIDEQVKMIIRGEVTIGNLGRGFDQANDEDLDKIPEEYFEEATDFATEYSDGFQEAVNLAMSNSSVENSETTKSSNENTSRSEEKSAERSEVDES